MGTYFTTYTLLAAFSGPKNVLADLKASASFGDPATYGFGTKIYLTDVASEVSVIDAVELIPYTSTPVPLAVQLQAAVAMCNARAANINIQAGTMPLTALYTLNQFIAGSTRFTASLLLEVALNLESYLATIDPTLGAQSNVYPAIFVNPNDRFLVQGGQQQKLPAITYSPGWEAWDGFKPPSTTQMTAGESVSATQPDNGYQTCQILFCQAVAQACRLASIGRLTSVVVLLNSAGQEYNNEQVRRAQVQFSVLNVVGLQGRLPQFGTVPSYMPDVSSVYTAGFGAFNTYVTTYGGSLINRVFSHPITSASGVAINVSVYSDVARLPGPVTINVSGTNPITYDNGCDLLIGVGTGGAAGGGNPYDLNSNGFLEGTELAAMMNDALKSAVTAQKAVAGPLRQASFDQLQTYVVAQGFNPANMADMSAAIQSIL
jgi:hypothetical protein